MKKKDKKYEHQIGVLIKLKMTLCRQILLLNNNIKRTSIFSQSNQSDY